MATGNTIQDGGKMVFLFVSRSLLADVDADVDWLGLTCCMWWLDAV